MASLDRSLGDFASARARYAEALGSQRELGDIRGCVATLGDLASLEAEIGSFEAAEAGFEEARRLAAEVGNRASDGIVQVNLGVLRALHERGYPEGDDDQKLASLVSADHPDIADRYRHGHAMLESVDGASSTENLRKAMLDFRAVLEDVLQGERTAA